VFQWNEMMITRLLAIAIVALPLAAQSHLVFYHIEAGTMGGGTHSRASIKIDGDRPTYKLAPDHVLTADIVPGSHTFYGDRKEYQHTYELEDGKTYYFRVQMMTGGTLRTSGMRVTLVPEDVGKAESSGLKR
jgi:hypothetical protein